MNKLLLSLLLACIAAVAGCGDREQYTAHRAERSKPKMEVGANMVSVRRAPYPNLDILPDGRLRVDDIEIPLDEAQRALLRTSFVKLQILRQNTLTESTAPPRRCQRPHHPAGRARRRNAVPAGPGRAHSRVQAVRRSAGQPARTALNPAPRPLTRPR